ncbi:MAG: hypothetical protein B1H11_02230 [Desulfobacteraceae bacterium 4484_190.1]|nr:MAG: hypothetical protein B1H11_02230 [Desulfobacteraceae bacterium 4484_190.1]
MMVAGKVHILRGGFIDIDRSIFLTGTDIGKKIKAPVCSFVIMHEEGPILVDAGLNPDGLTDPEHAWGPRARLIKPELTEADDVRNRLKELGLDVSDIKMVILTHLHWDHTGGLRFFTHCPVIVQKAEYRFAFNPDSFVSSQYMRNHFDFPLNYQLIEGDRMIVPGISVIRTPGHTPGHQSILIKPNKGNSYILSGDAMCLKDNLTLKIPSSNNWNNRQAMESIYRIGHLSELLKTEIISSHDMSTWKCLIESS